MTSTFSNCLYLTAQFENENDNDTLYSKIGEKYKSFIKFEEHTDATHLLEFINVFRPAAKQNKIVKLVLFRDNGPEDEAVAYGMIDLRDFSEKNGGLKVNLNIVIKMFQKPHGHGQDVEVGCVTLNVTHTFSQVPLIPLEKIAMIYLGFEKGKQD